MSDHQRRVGKHACIQGRLQGAVSAHHIYCGYVTRHMKRLRFVRSSEALNSSVTGAAAHMSLHLNQQCQRAERLTSPFSSGAPESPIDETRTRRARRPRPVGKQPYMEQFSLRQQLSFENFPKSSPGGRWTFEPVAPPVARHMRASTSRVKPLLTALPKTFQIS